MKEFLEKMSLFLNSFLNIATLVTEKMQSISHLKEQLTMSTGWLNIRKKSKFLFSAIICYFLLKHILPTRAIYS